MRRSWITPFWTPRTCLRGAAPSTSGTRSGLPRDIVHTRSFLVRPRDGEIKLRVILDRFSVEVFVNDGEQAASAVIYTRQEEDAVTFEAGGSVLMDVEKYGLAFNGQGTEG